MDLTWGTVSPWFPDCRLNGTLAVHGHQRSLPAGPYNSVRRSCGALGAIRESIRVTVMFDTVADIESFIQHFEACRLPKERWTHSAHLVAGFWYLSQHDMTQALDTVRRRIRSHNESVGTPNTDSSGYHETITRLYLTAIAAHIALHRALPFERSLATLLASPLAKSDWLLRYYTAERLFSAHARQNWVEPDLQPLEGHSP